MTVRSLHFKKWIDLSVDNHIYTNVYTQFGDRLFSVSWCCTRFHPSFPEAQNRLHGTRSVHRQSKSAPAGPVGKILLW